VHIKLLYTWREGHRAVVAALGPECHVSKRAAAGSSRMTMSLWHGPACGACAAGDFLELRLEHAGPAFLHLSSRVRRRLPVGLPQFECLGLVKRYRRQLSDGGLCRAAAVRRVPCLLEQDVVVATCGAHQGLKDREELLRATRVGFDAEIRLERI